MFSIWSFKKECEKWALIEQNPYHLTKLVWSALFSEIFLNYLSIQFIPFSDHVVSNGKVLVLWKMTRQNSKAILWELEHEHDRDLYVKTRIHKTVFGQKEELEDISSIKIFFTYLHSGMLALPSAQITILSLSVVCTLRWRDDVLFILVVLAFTGWLTLDRSKQLFTEFNCWFSFVYPVNFLGPLFIRKLKNLW